MDSIGKRIQGCREKQGMTQEQLARCVGLSTSYMSAIERGVKVPRLETFIRITNALHVTADILLVDKLERGFEIKSNILADKIGTLPKKEQDKIFHVIEVLVNDAQ